MQKLSVLVVDDEPEVLPLLHRMLIRLGDYAVQSESSPLLALDRIRSEHFDIVLTDVEMPQMLETALCHEIRSVSPTTLTILMSGSEPPQTAALVGAFTFLRKTFSLPEVRSVMKIAEEAIDERLKPG